MPYADLSGNAFLNFSRGFRSDATKESYTKKFRQFLQFANLSPDELLKKTGANPRFFEHLILDYIESRRKKVSGSSIHQTKDALRHFFELNDIESINWKKIGKFLPAARKVGSDRAPTPDEIRTILENCDLRMKCVVLLCCSSGIRIGALAWLRWGHVRPIQKNGKIVAAGLTIYSGEPEEYHTFVTSECYDVISQYMDRRRSTGERITGSSPLIRDTWDSNHSRRGRLDPSMANSVHPKTIANELGVLLKKIGLRGGSDKRYDFKQAHGFRKYFKTNAERAMKTVDVEYLMGHRTSYYKPNDEYLASEYAKAIPYLTLSEAAELKDMLQRQAIISDKKVGELERYNQTLQGRLDNLEKSYHSLRGALEATLLKSSRRKRY